MSGKFFPLWYLAKDDDRRFQAGTDWDMKLTVGGTKAISAVSMDVRAADGTVLVAFRSDDPPDPGPGVGTCTVTGRLIELHVDADVTAPFTAGDGYRYDLFLQLDGEETRLLFGPAVVVAKVTAPL